MSSEIKNADSFERILDNLAGGFDKKDKIFANEAGAKVFVETMKPKIPYRSKLRNVHGHAEKSHLRDSLIEVKHSNGSVHVGFTSKGEKGYIGRFLNDGWDVKDKNGETHSHVAGLDFWGDTQRDAKGKVGATVAAVLKEEMDKKVRGVK